MKKSTGELCSCDCTLVEFSKDGLLCPRCGKKKEVGKRNNKDNDDWDIERWDIVCP